MPQYFDLAKKELHPQPVNCIGFNCWHDYLSNPHLIDVFVSDNGVSFVFWQTIELLRISGEQKIKVKEVPEHVNYIRFVIKKNFGDRITYFNNVELYFQKPVQYHSTSTCKFIRQVLF